MLKFAFVLAGIVAWLTIAGNAIPWLGGGEKFLLLFVGGAFLKGLVSK